MVCGDRGDHFKHPSFVSWFGQILVGDSKTEAWTRVVITSNDVADGIVDFYDLSKVISVESKCWHQQPRHAQNMTAVAHVQSSQINLLMIR